MMLVMLVTMAETTGDIVAVTEIVGKPMTESMLTKALRADGFSHGSRQRLPAPSRTRHLPRISASSA